MKPAALPEACDFIGTPGTSEAFDNATEIDGDVMVKFCELAKEQQLWISVGGFHERLSGEVGKTKTGNTHCIIDDKGQTALFFIVGCFVVSIC